MNKEHFAFAVELTAAMIVAGGKVPDVLAVAAMVRQNYGTVKLAFDGLERLPVS